MVQTTTQEPARVTHHQTLMWVESETSTAHDYMGTWGNRIREIRKTPSNTAVGIAHQILAKDLIFTINPRACYTFYLYSGHDRH